jgi:AraC family transcriptional regulator
MRSQEASLRHGDALTPDAWRGFPLRISSYSGSGLAEGIVTYQDTLLLWSGGLSEVTMHARKAGHGTGEATTLQFTRQGGMVDFIPQGTRFDEIRWRGQACGCVSVAFERGRMQRLMGGAVPMFDAEDGFRVNVVDAHIVDLVRRLEAQAVQDEPWGALYVEGLSLTLATYVYGRYVNATAKEADVQLPVPVTEKLVAFVEEHLGGDIGLTDLAGQVGYSPDHLARMFKKAFGLPLYQYVLRRRVERAKALLRDHSHSIAEVALACGFATQSHFTSAFKARTGVTPGAYRRG